MEPVLTLGGLRAITAWIVAIVAAGMMWRGFLRRGTSEGQGLLFLGLALLVMQVPILLGDAVSEAVSVSLSLGGVALLLVGFLLRWRLFRKDVR